jgi:hypothetical protein
MVGEEVVAGVSPANTLPEGAGKNAPLIQKGNFECRPHLPRSRWGMGR